MILSKQSFKAAMSVLFVSMLMLAVTVPVNAQHQHQSADVKQQASEQGMMEMKGMMQQHMKDPFHHSVMLVHMLPTMREPLTLSEDQVTLMNQSKQQFKQQKNMHQKQMMNGKEQLQELMASGDAAPDRVRSLLEETASHQAQMQALAYETAFKMKGMLSAEQRTKLSEMKPMQMQRQMMMNMTMMEMMQAMGGHGMSGEEMGMMKKSN